MPRRRIERDAQRPARRRWRAQRAIDLASGASRRRAIRAREVDGNGVPACAARAKRAPAGVAGGGSPPAAGGARAPPAKFSRRARKLCRRVGRAAKAARPTQVAGFARHRPRAGCACGAPGARATGTSCLPAESNAANQRSICPPSNLTPHEVTRPRGSEQTIKKQKDGSHTPPFILSSITLSAGQKSYPTISSGVIHLRSACSRSFGTPSAIAALKTVSLIVRSG